MFDHVLFVERTCELRYAARLRSGRIGAAAKASLKRATNKLHDVDPKPGDLSMARLKWEYNPMEDRTRRLLKKAGMSCG